MWDKQEFWVGFSSCLAMIMSIAALVYTIWRVRKPKLPDITLLVESNENIRSIDEIKLFHQACEGLVSIESGVLVCNKCRQRLALRANGLDYSKYYEAMIKVARFTEPVRVKGYQEYYYPAEIEYFDLQLLPKQ